MKRPYVVCAFLALFAAPLLCNAAPTDDKTLLLLQRVASPGGDGATVLVGKLPSDMPKVPLPDAEIIGSVLTKPKNILGASLGSIQLYYQTKAGSADSYAAALKAAGWTAAPMSSMFRGGGFAESDAPHIGMYCHDTSMITTQVQGQDGTDLRVSLSTGTMADGLCSKGGPMGMASNMFSAMRAPLPNLHAPSGTHMSVSTAGIPGGKSGAYIRNGASLASLLDAFSSQLKAGGWTAGTSSASAKIGSQSFHIIDEKKNQWQAVLTVYAVDGKSGEFIAFIDATNVTSLTTP